MARSGLPAGSARPAPRGAKGSSGFCDDLPGYRMMQRLPASAWNRTASLRRVAILLLVCLSLPGPRMVVADMPESPAPRIAVEQAARVLMRAIQARDIERIVSFIAEDGISVADARLTREDVAEALRKPDTALHGTLFDRFDETDAKLCAAVGVFLASPYAYMERFGGRYDVFVERHGTSEFFSVSFEPRHDASGCRYVLFSIVFRVTGGRVWWSNWFPG